MTHLERLHVVHHRLEARKLLQPGPDVILPAQKRLLLHQLHGRGRKLQVDLLRLHPQLQKKTKKITEQVATDSAARGEL